jgi:hypothetical protein
MRAAARHDARPPILLLRSFFRYGLAFRPSALKDYGIEAGCSYTEDVAIALEKIGRLVAIGGPDETIEMFEKHSLYFQSSGTGWPEMFRLASSADAPDKGVLGNLALDTGGLLSTTWA